MYVTYERMCVYLHMFVFMYICLCTYQFFDLLCRHRGDGVDEVFIDTAKKIYQNIQDGSIDLNASETGVQMKPASTATTLTQPSPTPQKRKCCE